MLLKLSMIPFGFIAALLGFTGIMLLCLQVHWWLKLGVWLGIPLINFFVEPMGIVSDLIPYFMELRNWLIYPESWVGIQKIIKWILEVTPTSIFLFFLSFIVAIIAFLIQKKCREIEAQNDGI